MQGIDCQLLAERNFFVIRMKYLQFLKLINTLKFYNFAYLKFFSKF